LSQRDLVGLTCLKTTLMTFIKVQGDESEKKIKLKYKKKKLNWEKGKKKKRVRGRALFHQIGL
jgi:hypothetical protein